MRCLMLAVGVLLLAAGCRGRDGEEAVGQVGQRLLVDHATELSFRNHVKPVPDPAGGGGTVLVGERVSKSEHHMVFEQKGGFFKVPEGHRGAVVARVFVRQERRVRVALVAGGKLKSYYLQAPEEGRWCDLVLPLDQSQAKIAAGEAIDDISLWLQPPEGVKELRSGSEFYLERITFRPE
jgi:hypothetical protein